jgi:GxxExxY protein
MIDQEITHKIIGCAMKVHTKLGAGFQEVIYQRALSIELTAAGIPHKREVEMHIHYSGEHIGTRRVDFLVDDRIAVELKALSTLENIHLAQGLNYLEAYNIKVGLLINFGSNSLQYKRLLNKRAK